MTEPRSLTEKLLDWYAVQQRDLPWRKNTDPYRVWLAEIMLQQTRVETVIPYYQRWLIQFPTIDSVADATLQEILSAWEGLGYYARARNLYRSAQIVQKEYRGSFPDDYDLVRKLPGMGAASTADLLSICFHQDFAAVDGNIRRIFTRLYDLSEPVTSKNSINLIQNLAESHLIPGKAGLINQAWMDLGAMICTPRTPICSRCPMQADCLAYSHQTIHLRPVTSPRKQVPHYQVTAGIISREVNGQQTYLIARRKQEKLLGGLWEFPGGKTADGETLQQCLQRELKEELGINCTILDPLGTYKHAYTHFRVTLSAYHCQIISGEPTNLDADALAWVRPSELNTYPMGKIDRMISRDLLAISQS